MSKMWRSFALKSFLSGSTLQSSQHVKQVASRDLHMTAALCGEPLKKKKKLDPALLKLQTERRKKRLEKQLKKAQKFGRKLKPIDELELHREIAKNASKRKQEKLDTIQVKEQKAERYQILSAWKDYRRHQINQFHSQFSAMLMSQEKALNELKIASPELYKKACEIDSDLLPLTLEGPVETPAITDYIKDGVYKETTKSYELDPEIVKLMLDKSKTKKAKQ